MLETTTTIRQRKSKWLWIPSLVLSYLDFNKETNK